MKLTNPDDAPRVYLALRRSNASPPSISGRIVRLAVPATECPRCGSRRFELDGESERCASAKCHAARPVHVQPFASAITGGGRSDGRAYRMLLMAHLERALAAIERRDRFGFRAWSLVCVLGSVQAARRQGASLYPKQPGGWSWRQTAKRWETTRESVAAPELRRRGLLEGGR